MEPRSPRHMSNEERLNYALDLLDETFNALCWIGTGTFGVSAPNSTGSWTTTPPRSNRPDRVEKALTWVNKAMKALDKEAGLR